MMLRRCRRAVALVGALALCVARLGVMRARGPLTPVRRALWLQWACRGVLRSVGVRWRVVGNPPAHGLVVSNHLSYLDIAVFSAAMPCVFVSKADVRRWPYFGLAARFGGTVFVDRGSRAAAARAAQEIAQRLDAPVPVLLFPEGTSTDGAEVLRFHPALFQPALDRGAAITAASIRYLPGVDMSERAICWFGDEEFLPHLWRTLGAPAFSAEIRFGEPARLSDRRTAAQTTREVVAEMRAGKVSTLHEPAYASN